MSTWFWRVTEDPDDLSLLPDFIAYYEDEYEKAKSEVPIKGSLEKLAGRLPGIVEHRFAQLQEIEAVLKWMNEQHKLKKGEALRKYIEKYNRQLSPTVAEKYADSDPDVVKFSLLINQVALIRNKYQGLLKSLEVKNWMIGHITKLRTAGLEDSEINI